MMPKPALSGCSKGIIECAPSPPNSARARSPWKVLVARLLAERRDRPKVTARSVRNRFPGVITEVKKDGVAATVEILAGPHRILALITREAADEMALEPGMHAVATVKATNVMVEVGE